MKVSIKQAVTIFSLNVFLISTCLASELKTTLEFVNKTTQAIIETKPPLLDNAASFSPTQYDQQTLPENTLQPNGSTTAILSFNSQLSWNNISQFAFNYPGRSPQYGCFITEIRRSGWVENYRTLIASYRKDPEHPDDYLICGITAKSDTYTITFNSSQNTRDSKEDDSQRYAIIGNGFKGIAGLLTLHRFNINRLIPLNDILSLDPDKGEVTTDKFATSDSTLPQDAEKIKIINHTAENLIKKPTKLDRFSHFNSEYAFQEPATTLPPHGETELQIALPNFSRYALAQVSYQIAGHAFDSGCYITYVTDKYYTSSSDKIKSILIASFVNDPSQPKNLVCTVSGNQIDIYDDLAAIKVPSSFHLTQNDSIISVGGEGTLTRDFSSATKYFDSKTLACDDDNSDWSKGSSVMNILLDPQHTLAAESLLPDKDSGNYNPPSWAICIKQPKN